MGRLGRYLPDHGSAADVCDTELHYDYRVCMTIHHLLYWLTVCVGALVM